jgi:hypothetical protein
MKIKMKTFILAVIILTGFTGFLSAQSCANFINYQKVLPPYKYNSQSKSAKCLTGRTYKLYVTLLEGRDYKISFHASSVFDNKIHFKIIDETNGTKVLDAPGKTEDPSNKSSVLVPPFTAEGQGEYPYFEFFPETSTKLFIEIAVAPVPDEQRDKVGCIGVLIQDKPTEMTGFGFE